MNRMDIAVSLVYKYANQDIFATCYLLGKMGVGVPSIIFAENNRMRFRDEITIAKVDPSWYIGPDVIHKIGLINSIDCVEFANLHSLYVIKDKMKTDFDWSTVFDDKFFRTMRYLGL